MPYRFYGNAMSFKREKKKNAVYELEIFLFSSRSAFVRGRICYAAVTSNLKLQWLRKTKAYFFSGMSCVRHRLTEVSSLRTRSGTWADGTATHASIANRRGR